MNRQSGFGIFIALVFSLIPVLSRAGGEGHPSPPPFTPPVSVETYVAPGPIKSNATVGPIEVRGGPSSSSSNSKSNSSSDSNSNANAASGASVDSNINVKGGPQNQNQSQSATTGPSNSTSSSTNEGVRSEGNKTDIRYDAPKIPVASPPPVYLPPVVCASASNGMGVTTQVFGFNFGRSDSREKCWESKEATECVNLAVAVTNTFGMRQKMAIVAVGCTVKSPTFVQFAAELGRKPVDLAKEILDSYQEEEATRARLLQAEQDKKALEDAKRTLEKISVDSKTSERELEEARRRANEAETRLLLLEQQRMAARKQPHRKPAPKPDCDCRR